MRAATDFSELLSLIRTARGLEAGGYNGLAKLVWALAYSAEIQATNAAGIPRGEALDAALAHLLETLKADGVGEAITGAFEKGWQAVRADRTVPFTDIPEVHVSRTTGEIYLGQPPEVGAGSDHRLALREFKPVWYLDALTPAEVVVALEQNPAVIQSQLDGLTAAQLVVAPAAGEWNMHQLLAHILMAQELLAERVALIAAHDNPDLASGEVWAPRDQEVLSTGDVLERYLDSRGALVARLKELPAADWWRPGWHTEFGAQTLLSQATYFARHEVSHLPQFAEIRRAIGL